MLLIYAVMFDGTKTLLLTTRDVELDVQQWVNSRAGAFRLLGIAAIEYEVISDFDALAEDQIGVN